MVNLLCHLVIYVNHAANMSFKAINAFCENNILPKIPEITVLCFLYLYRGPMKLRPDEDVLLGLLPFYHIYGLVVVQFGALSQGARLITLPKFDPMTFLESIQKQKVRLSWLSFAYFSIFYFMVIECHLVKIGLNLFCLLKYFL